MNILHLELDVVYLSEYPLKDSQFDENMVHHCQKWYRNQMYVREYPNKYSNVMNRRY
ncbi:MAG: hypothetical protein IJ575_10000 [Selenomonadaceae bacterium]|nr:hypothetical protein [Selenomonadaceae bacterium]